MPEYLTTREVAELLRIKERKVYDLAASGELTCSKAMGKLLFPKDAVHAWLRPDGGSSNNALHKQRPNVCLGSHDPLLDWALRESGCGLASYFDGSEDGLERFVNFEGLATGLHIIDEADGSWNVTTVREHCAGQPAVLTEWATRQRGLVLAKSVPHSVGSISALKGLTIAARQPEAGAQKLFDHLLREAGVQPGTMEVTGIARTESDAALAVAQGKADATFGLASVAEIHGLRFVPIIQERYDLLVDRRAWFEPAWQQFWAFCQTTRFQSHARELTGYGISGLGTVHHNGP